MYVHVLLIFLMNATYFTFYFYFLYDYSQYTYALINICIDITKLLQLRLYEKRVHNREQKKCKNEKNLRVNSQASIECKVYLSTDLAFLHCGNKAQHYLLSSVREILEIGSGDDVRDS